ncbi:MAG TPA: hypothetical protein VM618_03230, partial [Acidimicrobiia bacterium]|nr:hypothetical protein [Acidimicrobiia bacterium]
MTGIFQTSGATREVSDDRMAPTGDRVSDAVDAELRRIGVHLGRLKVEIEEERAVHALERTTLVSDAVERLRHILHDVRWLADLDQVALEAEWVELEQVVTALLDRWHGRLRAADALVIREPLPAVWVSRADVSIVLEELLENAVRYRGSDPLVIRISA